MSNWINRNAKIIVSTGKPGKGKTTSALNAIFDWLRMNRDGSDVGEVYCPFPVWDGDPHVGPATLPLRQFDNRDGHLPGLARTRVVTPDNWNGVFRKFARGGIKHSFLVLDEVNRLARARDYLSAMNAFIENVASNAVKYGNTVYVTTQGGRNFELHLREIVSEVRVPLLPFEAHSTILRSEELGKNFAYTMYVPVADGTLEPASFEEIDTSDPQAPTKDSDIIRAAKMDYVESDIKIGNLITYYNRGIPPNYWADNPLSQEDVEEILRGDGDSLGFYDWALSGESFLQKKPQPKSGFKFHDAQLALKVWLAQDGSWFLTEKHLLQVTNAFLVAQGEREPTVAISDSRSETVKILRPIFVGYGVCPSGHRRNFRKTPSGVTQCQHADTSGICRRVIREFHWFDEEGKREVAGQ